METRKAVKVTVQTAVPVALAGLSSGLLVGLWLDRKWWQALVVGSVAGVAAGAGMWSAALAYEAAEERARGITTPAGAK